MQIDIFISKVGNSMSDKFWELWDFLAAEGIATDNEINLACYIGGRSEETLEAVMFLRTGYRNIDQYYMAVEE